MSPQLMQRQIRDGAWALTVATMHQLRICRKFGARRLLLANQPIGTLEVDWLLAEMRGDQSVEIYCLVDSEAGVEILEQGVVRSGLTRPLPVLVEVGYGGGRTGRRDVPSALELLKRVRRSPHLALAGLETFEGLHQFKEMDEALSAVRSLLHTFATLLERARAEDLFECGRPMVSAGGSAFYPEVIEEFVKLDATVVIRSGCYITHDHGIYERWRAIADERRPGFGGPKAAFEVWGIVQSIPEPGLAIVTAGRRDFGIDSGAPKPILCSRSAATRSLLDDRWSTMALSDQHAHVRIPTDGDLRVGDKVGFGISHPCTTFDKWDVIYLIDDDYNIIDAIKTYF
jgi:D-serine dehydratase